jgi:PAS domain S-box-containing protein
MHQPPSTETVLIVEDDAGLARLVGKALNREGIGTAAAATVAETLERLNECRPALLVLDLKLKGEDGVEVVNELERSGRRMPFIVMTGQGDERVAVEMMKRGAMDYLVKDAQFMDRVTAVVRRSLDQIARDRRLAEAEAALRREHSFTSAILDTAGALVVVLDPKGRIVRLNRAFEHTTGYDLDEVKGESFLERFIEPEDRRQVEGVFANLRAGSGATGHENAIRTRAGGLRRVHWTNTSLMDADGRVEFVIGTGIDITGTRELEREVLQAGELERRRISQDLHDGICQQLAGIELMSQALEQRLERESRPEAAQAATIAAGVRQAIAETRMLSRGLSPVPVEKEGLMAALKELAAATKTRFGVECVLSCDPPVPVEDRDVALHLFRIAQEAVGNAVRHARTRRILISLTRTPRRLALAVNDQGIGIDARAGGRGGMGLRIMEYRAGMIGGSLAVQRCEQGGTSVVCTVRSGDDT